jgi:hypothetical protein
VGPVAWISATVLLASRAEAITTVGPAAGGPERDSAPEARCARQ